MSDHPKDPLFPLHGSISFAPDYRSEKPSTVMEEIVRTLGDVAGVDVRQLQADLEHERSVSKVAREQRDVLTRGVEAYIAASGLLMEQAKRMAERLAAAEAKCGRSAKEAATAKDLLRQVLARGWMLPDLRATVESFLAAEAGVQR